MKCSHRAIGQDWEAIEAERAAAVERARLAEEQVRATAIGATR